MAFKKVLEGLVANFTRGCRVKLYLRHLFVQLSLVFEKLSQYFERYYFHKVMCFASKMSKEYIKLGLLGE